MLLKIKVYAKVHHFLNRVIQPVATHFRVPKLKLAKRKQVSTAEVNPKIGNLIPIQ